MGSGATARRLGRLLERHLRLVIALVAVPVLLVLAVVGAGWDTEFVAQEHSGDGVETVDVAAPDEFVFWPFMIVGVLMVLVLLYVLLRNRAATALLVVGAIGVAFVLIGMLGGALSREDAGGLVSDDDAEAARELVRAGEPAVWLVVLLAIVAVLAGSVVWIRGRRAAPPLDDERVAEGVEALADELDDVEGPARQAIIRMYASLERLLAREGRARRRAETTAEFSARVLATLGAPGELCRDLAALYEEVAFGERIAVERDRARASALLRLIGADVREVARRTVSVDA